MTRRLALLWIALLAPLAAPAQPTTALVGGTLIDGYGGAPVHDSVVLIQGERIQAVGRQGEVQIPTDAEVISSSSEASATSDTGRETVLADARGRSSGQSTGSI